MVNNIASIKLKIEASISLLSVDNNFFELKGLLESKYEDLNNLYNGINKEDIKYKEYYALLSNFLDLNVKLVLNLYELYKKNNYESIYDDSDKEISDKLESKIREISEYINKTKEDYEDSLADYIKVKYEKILEGYHRDLSKYFEFKRNSIINELKYPLEKTLEESVLKSVPSKLTLYKDANTIKKLYFDKLSFVFNDFLVYLKTLNNNKYDINNKEKTIEDNLLFIKEKLNFDLMDYYEKIHDTYYTQINNIKSIDMNIGKLQMVYIESLQNIINIQKRIIEFIDKNEKIKDIELLIKNSLDFIKKYENCSLEEEFIILKRSFWDNIRKIDYLAFDFKGYQDEYLRKLKGFQTRVMIKDKKCHTIKKGQEYIKLLENNVPIAISKDMIKEIKLFQKDNHNELLEKSLTKYHYDLLCIFINSNLESFIYASYEEMNSDEKINIEKLFVYNLKKHIEEEFTRNILTEYCQSGFNINLFIKYIKGHNIKNDVEVISLEGKAEREYFGDDSILINNNGDYLLINHNDNVVKKIEIPVDAKYVKYSHGNIIYLLNERNIHILNIETNMDQTIDFLNIDNVKQIEDIHIIGVFIIIKYSDSRLNNYYKIQLYKIEGGKLSSFSKCCNETFFSYSDYYLQIMDRDSYKVYEISSGKLCFQTRFIFMMEYFYNRNFNSQGIACNHDKTFINIKMQKVWPDYTVISKYQGGYARVASKKRKCSFFIDERGREISDEEVSLNRNRRKIRNYILLKVNGDYYLKYLKEYVHVEENSEEETINNENKRKVKK